MMDEVDGSPSVSPTLPEAMDTSAQPGEKVATDKGQSGKDEDEQHESTPMTQVNHSSYELNTEIARTSEIPKDKKLENDDCEESELVIDFDETNLLAPDSEEKSANGSDAPEEAVSSKADENVKVGGDRDTGTDKDTLSDKNKKDAVVEVVSKDIGLDYFDRLENSLRELEKQMSKSSPSEVTETSSDVEESTADRIVKIPYQNGLKSQDDSNNGKVNKTEDGVTMNSTKSTQETSSGTEPISSESTDKIAGPNVDSQQSTSGATTKDSVKVSLPNANEMWSKLGMMRCTNCSFTTDQESMFNSHTVICNKRSVTKGDISLKFKLDRYGCEACLYTTKSQRNFEEHVAFHLLAQPYICLKCVSTFESKASIEIHVSTKHCNEMVKCGLRGSKKISHILEALHKDSKFTFTGRLLDKKIWNMSVTTPKDQSTSSQSGHIQKSGQSITSSTTKASVKVSEKSKDICTTTRESVKVSEKTPVMSNTEPSNVVQINSTQKQITENVGQNVPVTKPTSISQPSTVISKGNPATISTCSSPRPVLHPQNTTMVRPKIHVQKTYGNMPIISSGSNTLAMSMPATSTTTSSGNIAVPIILVPVTMASSSGIISPTTSPSAPGMVFPFGSSQQPMIVMNPPNVVHSAPAPTRFMLVPTTPKGPTVNSVSPTSIVVSNSMIIQQQNIACRSLLKNTPILPATSSSHHLANQCISIQYSKNEMTKTDSSETPRQENNTAGKVESTVIDLTEGDTKASCRMSFRKAGESFACDFCKVATDSADKFGRHIWRHLHSAQPICKECSPDCNVFEYARCNLVSQVMKGLASMDSSKSETSQENNVIEVMSDDEDSASKVDKEESSEDVSKPDDVLDITDDDDGGLQIKIASTYSLSSSVTTQKNDDVEKEIEIVEPPEEPATEETTTLAISLKKKDSGNIFEKLQGSINLVVNDIYKDGPDEKEDETPSLEPSEVDQSADIPHPTKNCESRHQSENIESPHQSVRNESPATSESHPLNSSPEKNSNDTLVPSSGTETTSVEKNESKPATPDFSSNGTFYVCGFHGCSFACITSGEYREHLTCWHADAEQFNCSHCGHGSITEDCHLRHMLTHSKASSFVLYTCSQPACLYGTNVVDLFRDHWKKFHTNAKKFRCRSCKMLYSSADDLIAHIQANILKFVICPHCTAKDSNRKTIIAHIIEAHPGKPRQITVASQLVCQERGANDFTVPLPGITEIPPDLPPWPSVYVESAHDDDDDDDDAYANSSEHDYIVDDVDDAGDDLPRPSSVTQAKSSLTRITAEGDMRDAEKVMTLNKRKLKSLSSEVIRCSQCSYLASGRGLLRKHVFLHKRGKDDRKRRFSCPCCPAAADKLSKISCHLNLHEGDHKLKIYFCTLCTFKTNVKELLSVHVNKSHNLELVKGSNFITKVLKVSVTAYFCDECDFGTRDQEVYRQHKQSHNDGELDHGSKSPISSMSTYPKPSTSTYPNRSTSSDKSSTKTITSSTSDTPSAKESNRDSMSVSPGKNKRFSCKICGKYCSRLPALKNHMSSHTLDDDLEVLVFKCQYCAYSSTYKAYVGRHCQDKHPGKVIRIKRRVDIISAGGDYCPPHGQEWPDSPEEMEDSGRVDVCNMSIYTQHCDLCSYSCSDTAELLRHRNSHHAIRAAYQEPKKSFIIPGGNVFKSPVECSECSFATKLRLELLRHIKTHPGLSPTTMESPPRNEQPRELLKVAIGKKNTSCASETYSKSPSPTSDPDAEQTEVEDQKPTLAEDGSVVQENIPKPKQKTPLYFLGGDLLHLKLKPCFVEETKSEFTCKLCQDTFSGRYVLHKHILQHMDVSFYKCAYCNHGTLESPSMVVHIQKIHRKPIQHVQMDVTDLESKINQAIHSIKEEEYLVKMQDDDGAANPTKKKEYDSGDDFQPFETPFRSPFKAKVPPLTIKTSPSYDIMKKKSGTAKKSTTSVKPKPQIPYKSPQKLPIEDNPNIQRMGDIYKCRVCSYTSTSRATVFNHLTIHSGFRRFGCPFCTYRSHWRHDCHKHIRTHHPEKQGLPMDDLPPDLNRPLDGKSEKHSKMNKQIKSEKRDETTSVPKEPKVPLSTPSPNLQPKPPQQTKLEKQRSVESEPDQNKNPEYRYVFKCLVCDVKFKSIWAIQKHFSKSCSQPMLGCSSCKFKDLEPGNVKLHIETKHPGNEASRIITLKREAKIRKYTIPTVTYKKPESKDGVESTESSKQSANVKQQQPASRKVEISSDNVEYSKLKSPIPGPGMGSLSMLIKYAGNRYVCRECGFGNPVRRALLRHVKKHNNARPFACPYCEYRSNNECNTKRHVRRRHTGKPVTVSKLDPSQWCLPISDDLKYRRKSVSERKKELETETATTSQDGLPDDKDGDAVPEDPNRPRVEIRYFWKCLECGNKSNSVSNAYRHLKKGLCTKTLYGCSGCKLKNTDKREVEQHLREKHLNKNKNVQITICPNTAKIRKYNIPIKIGTGHARKSSTASVESKNSSQVVQSQKEVSSKQNSEQSQIVFCSVCNLKASNAKIFQSHLETEHPGMLMVCKHCTIFRTQFVSKIQQHVWDSHPNNPLRFYLRTKKGVPDEEKRPSERYTCAKCDYVGKRSSVRQHLYCHFEYKPYKCGHCGYETKKNDGVKRHIEKQHMGKPIKIIFKRDPVQEEEIESLLDSNSPVKLSLQKSQAARHAKEIGTSPGKMGSSPILKRKHSSSVNMLSKSSEDFVPSKMYKAVYNTKFGRTGFTCLMCPYSTYMQNTIISHVYHHMSCIYRCPYCSNHGYPRSKVTLHIRRQHPGKAVYVIDDRIQKKEGTGQWDASSTVSSAGSQLDVKSEPDAKRRKMDVGETDMDDTITYADSTSDSMKEETGIIQYSCHLCDYSSESLYHYRQHLAIHGGFKWLTGGTQLESRLKCGYCSYLAANDLDFNSHMERHLSTLPFSCPYCDFSQYTHSKVKIHVQYAHPDKPVEVSKESGSSCLIEDTLQLNSVTLVKMDPKVKVVDILTLGPRQYETLLLEADVSVVDFDNLPDDRFTAVASNLGIVVTENEYEVKKEMMDNEYEEDNDTYGYSHGVKTEKDDAVDEQSTIEAVDGEMDIGSIVSNSGEDINSVAQDETPTDTSESTANKDAVEQQGDVSPNGESDDQQDDTSPIESHDLRDGTSPIESHDQKDDASPIESCDQNDDAPPIESHDQQDDASPIESRDHQKDGTSPIENQDQKDDVSPIDMDGTSPIESRDQEDDTSLIGSPDDTSQDMETGDQPSDTCQDMETDDDNERPSTSKTDDMNELSDVSEEPLSQEDDSQDANTAEESVEDMEFENNSQESLDLKENSGANTVSESVNEESKEKENKGEEKSVNEHGQTEEAVNKREEASSELDTSYSNEPMWESQGFEVIDEA